VSHWDNNLARIDIDHEFFAIGSGAAIALGAMAFGASAEVAVEIACRYDTCSGPPVVRASLND